MAEGPPPRSQSSAGSPASPEIEEPTAAAELHIVVLPAKDLTTPAKSRGRRLAEGRGVGLSVPADQARSLAATLGELASLIIGVAAAVLTLRLVPGATGVVFAAAELVLTLAVAVLIAKPAWSQKRHMP